MSWYKVVLAVASGVIFDTGRRIETRVLARDMLDAAIRAEAKVDRTLEDPAVEYSHTRQVIPIEQNAAPALALAA